MNVLDLLQLVGIIPLAEIAESKNAVPLATALKAGGLPVVEVALRTQESLAAIRAIAESDCGVMVGAGTVLSIEEADSAIAAGAQFIVMPGFNRELVEYCIKKGVSVLPGVLTPSEVMAALNTDLTVFKCFPAGSVGGMAHVKALGGPFRKRGVRLVPTGGASEQNLGEFMCSDLVHSVGGSWIAPADTLAAGRFDDITASARRAVAISLGFEFAHVGINFNGEQPAMQAADTLEGCFAIPKKPGNTSIFSGPGLELMKSVGRGSHGHLAIRTNNISRAVYRLEPQGIRVIPDSVVEKAGRPVAAYLNLEIAGFAVHLLQK